MLNGFGVIVDFVQIDSVTMATLWSPKVQSGHRVAIGMQSIWKKSMITPRPFKISEWNFPQMLTTI